MCPISASLLHESQVFPNDNIPFFQAVHDKHHFVSIDDLQNIINLDMTQFLLC